MFRIGGCMDWGKILFEQAKQMNINYLNLINQSKGFKMYEEINCVQDMGRLFKEYKDYPAAMMTLRDAVSRWGQENIYWLTEEEKQGIDHIYALIQDQIVMHLGKGA
jgi:hypothetical protein